MGEKFALCKGIQNSLGFWIPRRGLRIPGTGFWILCQWKLDSRSQSLVDSRILELYSGFHSPGFRIPQVKICWIPQFGFLYIGRENGVLWSSRGLTIDFRGTRGGGGRRLVVLSPFYFVHNVALYKGL